MKLLLCALTLTLALVIGTAPALAYRQLTQPITDWTEGGAIAMSDPGGAPVSSHADTVWFGGSGTGSGSIVRGGTWSWEASSGETPQFFVDGDPVGNQYRDGWTFEDRTARRGPSQTGAGHWDLNGNYNFDNDGGSFAHRATTHANDGENDGPDPLDNPANPAPSAWSIWIGTNLRLNPENCGWGQIAGYSDGWSQGIQKAFAIPTGNQGAVYDLRFYHRYAVEAGWDTCWVEISFDGRFWDQVGDANLPNGVFSGGSQTNPQPSAAGALEVVNLLTWPTNAAGTLYVRFRLTSDALFSDNSMGGDFFWAWQIDDVELLRNNVSQGLDGFETGMNGWRPKSFEGFDFDITTDPERPAGRIESIANLTCPPLVACPEACVLDNHVLLFADRDECDLNDNFQDSYATSRAFAIGGPTQPDLDGDAGRLFAGDMYFDGGAGFFETGPAIFWAYWPVNAYHCPYTPAAGEPGAGTTFNWSQSSGYSFSQGSGPYCAPDVWLDVSAGVPADADSMILHVGVFSQCRSNPSCDIADNGAPFYDNLRFGVFHPRGITVSSFSGDRYADNFPISNGPITTTPARMDGAHSWTQNAGGDNPLRWVRSDTAVAHTGAANTALYLRWAVERGPCQTNLNHPFFVAFPLSAPNTFPSGLVWHAARMDTTNGHGTGEVIPGSYMTCFHEADPRNGTYWTGPPPAVEPCDDILPDGLFTAGTNVYYFFEARDATTGDVTGTFPSARSTAPTGATPNYRNLWLQSNNLPQLTPACDGTYANSMLLVNDYATLTVPGRSSTQRARLAATLESLGLEFDIYDVVNTSQITSYDTIGRREDRPTQQPRPPYNGATDMMLDNYDVIWYTSGLIEDGVLLSDQLTESTFGGQPSMDQQKLETWIAGCTAGHNRLLILEGTKWASWIDGHTTNGPAFLTNRGVDVLASDYAQQLANNDLRRCARITSSRPADRFDDAEIFGSGCPDDYPNVDVFAAIAGGEAVAHFVESHEDGSAQVYCLDDSDRPAWLAAVRKTNPAHTCERSVSMSFAFAELNPLDCVDECLYDNYRINGENAELVIDFFTWAGMPINPRPIGVGEPAGAPPRFVNELYQALPSPANPTTTIRFAIAEKGHVSLRIFDVSGRLVRTLVDQVMAPAAEPFAVVWDGKNDAGDRVGSGVFFYQIDAPGFTAAKKLVILK